jgi:hypothetical protein
MNQRFLYKLRQLWYAQDTKAERDQITNTAFFYKRKLCLRRKDICFLKSKEFDENLLRHIDTALLYVDLIPKSSWFSSLRSILPDGQWDILRREAYKRARYECEICGGKGDRHPVECHEIWEYKDDIQKLVGLQAICPMCHQVKHIGLALTRNDGDIGPQTKHMMYVNDWSRKETYKHIDDSFEVWRNRDYTNWKLDISLIQDKLG